MYFQPFQRVPASPPMSESDSEGMLPHENARRDCLKSRYSYARREKVPRYFAAVRPCSAFEQRRGSASRSRQKRIEITLVSLAGAPFRSLWLVIKPTSCLSPTR